jgi:hypothetical protein
MRFTRVPGHPTIYLTVGPNCLTSFLQMMSSFSIFQSFLEFEDQIVEVSSFLLGRTPQAKINKITFITDIRSTTSLDKYLGFPILNEESR